MSNRTPPDFMSRREAEMSKKSKPSGRTPQKTYWHLYSLQTLNSEKFIKVVNKILRNEYHLIK